MHDEQAIILCRMRLDERLAEAERARLAHTATGGREGWQMVASGVGGTLVRAGRWLQVAGGVCLAEGGYRRVAR